MSDVVRDGRSVGHGLRVGPGLVNAWRWVCRAFVARIGWVAAGLLLILLGFDAKAQTVSCPAGQVVTKWTFGGVSETAHKQPSCTAGVTVTAGASGCVVTNYTYQGGRDYLTGPTCSGTGGLSVNCVYQRFREPTGSSSIPLGIVTASYNATCGLPQCTLPSGTKFRISAPGAIDGTFCFSNCSVTTDYGAPVIDISETKTRFGVVSSGATCSNNNSEAEGTDAEGTVTDGTDTLKGFDQTGQQCGYVNGEYVCLATIPAGDCTLTPGKTAVCSPGATPPKAPDNGTPGQAATPNATITNNGGNGNTYNVYNSSTVNNSTNMGSGDPDGDGSDSSGECDPGDTACEGGGRGDGRVSGPGGTTKTYGASAASLYAAIQGSPIGQAVNGISSGMPTGGTCPVISMNLPIIGAISSDMHCDLWAGTVAPLLQLVFLAIWALIAVRIVLEG